MMQRNQPLLWDFIEMLWRNGDTSKDEWSLSLCFHPFRPSKGPYSVLWGCSAAYKAPETLKISAPPESLSIHSPNVSGALETLYFPHLYQSSTFSDNLCAKIIDSLIEMRGRI